MPAPLPDEAFASFEREIELLTSAERTGAPTQDPQSDFFGVPSDEFVECLLVLRDEIEQRAYLAIVAAIEAVVQVDLNHRHWLAHGRYFVNRAGVSDDPGFAIARARALLAELKRLDPKFPRAS